MWTNPNSYKKLLSALCLCVIASNAIAKERILIVDSYDAGMFWVKEYKKQLTRHLGTTYDLPSFSLDTKRLPAERHGAMAEKAWDYYLQLHPKLVILADDPALQWLGKRISNHGTAVIYLGINNRPDAYFKLSEVSNITGVLERPALAKNIFLAKKLLPKAKNALILFDESITAQIIRQENFKASNSITIDNIKVDIKLLSNWQQWQTYLKSAAKQYDFILVGLYHSVYDNDGKHVPSESVIRFLSKHSTVPLFGFWDFAIAKDKAMGGLTISSKAQGELAAEMALAVLDGKKPESISPEITTEGQLLFSRYQLKRFNLTLPEAWQKDTQYVD